MSCKGRASWQEQQGLCSRVKAARDGGDQEPWGPFRPNPATYLPSPPAREKDLTIYCQEDGAKQLLESTLQLASSLPTLPA